MESVVLHQGLNSMCETCIFSASSSFNSTDDNNRGFSCEESVKEYHSMCTITWINEGKTCQYSKSVVDDGFCTILW